MSTTTSTPSKKGTASRTASRTPGKLATDLHNDIGLDIRETKTASFDSFLRLFLSRCLDGNSKDKFEKLQLQIEQHQSARLNAATLRTTPRSCLEPTHSEGQTVPEAEKTLVEERDELLGQALDESLESILKVANAQEIRGKLVAFGTSIKTCSLEVDRYQPYAELYNCALDELAKSSSTSLRPQAKHRLCFCRADPQPILNAYFNTAKATERKPDFVRVAHAAAIGIHPNSKFGEEPANSFQWAQVPSCEEVKAFGTTLSTEAGEVFNHTHIFTAKLKKPAVGYFFVPAETLENAQNKSGSKRARSITNSASAPSFKKSRSSVPAAGSVSESESKRSKDARIQVASYAMEMLSYGPGVAHVINTLVVDEYIYIWYYDRQGTICSPGISIIADFPRFLVLLLAFQRFTAEEWGIVPCLNPRAVGHLGTTLPLTFVGDNNFDLQLSADNFEDNFFISDQLQPTLTMTDEYLSHQPHCLSGRSTSVMKSSSNGKPTACKISSPEAQRIPEGDVLKTVQILANQEASEMRKHLPTHHFSGDFRAGSTLRVRSVLGIDPKGYRVMRMLVFDKLDPLTSLTDDAVLIKAWSDIVACHAFLWKYGIEHGDPSLWNMMVDPDTHSGILNDFDLTNLAFLHRVPGNERTGTIPFMALDLLTEKYWNGHINRYYHHDLEAFIWSIVVVYFGHCKGQLDLQNAYIKDWFTSDHNACKNAKLSFLRDQLFDVADQMDNSRYFGGLIYHLCTMLFQQDFNRNNAKLTSKNSSLRVQPISSDVMQIQFSGAMWDSFIPLLESLELKELIAKYKPFFDTSSSEALRLFTVSAKIFSTPV